MDISTQLLEKQGYLKWNAKKISQVFKISLADADSSLKKAKKIVGLMRSPEAVKKFIDYVENTKEEEYYRRPKLPKPYLKGDSNNVLVIGDLHEPFCLDDYLLFCRNTQETFNCGKVIFIGDIMDNHYTSYHEIESTALSLEDEFEAAQKRIQDWYQTFPNAKICIGNHDRMVYRKCKTGGISGKWVRDYKEVLETPGWEFKDEFEYNGVIYVHGEGGSARDKARQELQSQVQGHRHSEGYVDIMQGNKKFAFAMQVGCGIDRRKYAFAYNQAGKKPVISCGVVLNKGTLPILIPMTDDFS